jgi:hypothetical protein
VECNRPDEMDPIKRNAVRVGTHALQPAYAGFHCHLVQVLASGPAQQRSVRIGASSQLLSICDGFKRSALTNPHWSTSSVLQPRVGACNVVAAQYLVVLAVH